jgi:hypothetical protein
MWLERSHAREADCHRVADGRSSHPQQPFPRLSATGNRIFLYISATRLKAIPQTSFSAALPPRPSISKTALRIDRTSAKLQKSGVPRQGPSFADCRWSLASCRPNCSQGAVRNQPIRAGRSAPTASAPTSGPAFRRPPLAPLLTRLDRPRHPQKVQVFDKPGAFSAASSKRSRKPGCLQCDSWRMWRAGEAPGNVPARHSGAPRPIRKKAARRLRRWQARTPNRQHAGNPLPWHRNCYYCVLQIRRWGR